MYINKAKKLDKYINETNVRKREVIEILNQAKACNIKEHLAIETEWSHMMHRERRCNNGNSSNGEEGHV